MSRSRPSGRGLGRPLTVAVMAIVLLGGLHTVLWACPTCSDGLFDPQGAATQSRVLKGYAVSIAALLGVPLLMVGGIAWRLVRSSRRGTRSGWSGWRTLDFMALF